VPLKKDGVNGTVSVRAGIELTEEAVGRSATHDNNIGIVYKGTQSEHMNYIQFGYLEVLKHKGENRLNVAEGYKVTDANGNEITVSSSKNPIPFLDANIKENKDPVYIKKGSTSGWMVNGGDQAAMWDAPMIPIGLAGNLIHDSKIAGSDTFDVIGHFDTYLVWNKQPLFKVSWTVTASFSADQQPSRHTDLKYDFQEGYGVPKKPVNYTAPEKKLLPPGW